MGWVARFSALFVVRLKNMFGMYGISVWMLKFATRAARQALTWLDGDDGLTCSSSDEYSSGLGCSNALTATGNAFHNKAPKGDQSIEFDFGSVYAISGFREHCSDGWGPGSAINAFEIQHGPEL